MLIVSDQLDLIEVAAALAEDNKEAVTQWLEEGRLAKVSDEQARLWLEVDASLWAVVVRPWILVQMRAS